jgi:hypothetical protein
MKNIKLLLGLLSVVIVMASCATMGAAGNGSDDAYRSNRMGNRVYVDDPYHGTVVLERDPYTGRYYDVTYGSRYRGGYYGASPGRYYRGNRGSYGRVPVIQQPQQQRPSREELNRSKQETRNKVLGN